MRKWKTFTQDFSFSYTATVVAFFISYEYCTIHSLPLHILFSPALCCISAMPYTVSELKAEVCGGFPRGWQGIDRASVSSIHCSLRGLTDIYYRNRTIQQKDRIIYLLQFAIHAILIKFSQVLQTLITCKWRESLKTSLTKKDTISLTGYFSKYNRKGKKIKGLFCLLFYVTAENPTQQCV